MGLSVCGLALRADSLPVRQFSSDMQMAAAWDYVLRYGQGEPVPAFIEKMCLEYIGSQSLKLWKVDLCRKVILEKKLIQADDFDAFLKMAQESGNPDLTAQLEQYGERCFTEQELASVREKRKLDTQVENARANAPMSTMELRRLWKCQQWGQQSAYQYISGCRASTREVVVPAFIGRTPIVAIGSDAFNEERKRGSLQEEIRKGREQIETVIIEEGIQEICQQGFGSFYSLKNLKLPDSLRYIRRFAFRDCVNLKELTIPRHVGRIGESAFRNCRSLRLLVLQGSKTSLSEVEDPKDIPENLVIRAPEDSPARQWAQEYGVTFEVLS